MIAGLDIRKRLEMVTRLVGARLYAYQVAYVLTHNDPTCRYDLWNKARQIGLTEVAVADMAVEALVSPDYVGLLLSTKQDKANRLIHRMKAMYRRIGPTFYRELIRPPENKESLVLANGASIFALSASAKDARSETADAAVADEFAHNEQQAEILTALMPALARRGRLTLISTPNKPGDVFHDYATHPTKFGIRAFEIPWWDCPDLTPEFIESARDMCRATGKSFEQEFECQFVAPEASIYPWELLAGAEVETSRVSGKGRRYIGWDPARDRDSSGVVILEIEGEQIEIIGCFDLARRPYPEQVNEIKSLSLRYRVRRTYIDSFSQGDPLADYLGRTGVQRMKMRPDDKRAAAAYIKYKLEEGKLSIAPGVQLGRTLLKHLQGFDNEKGDFPFQDHTGHSDLGSALFLAWQAVPRKKRRAARNRSADFRSRGVA